MCNQCKDPEAIPCCDQGTCDAAPTSDSISLCVHCGAEMLRRGGFWYHYSQFIKGELISPEMTQGEWYDPPNK